MKYMAQKTPNNQMHLDKAPLVPRSAGDVRRCTNTLSREFPFLGKIVNRDNEYYHD